MKRSATTDLLTAKIEEDRSTLFTSENRCNDLYLHQHNKAVSINVQNNQTAHFQRLSRGQSKVSIHTNPLIGYSETLMRPSTPLTSAHHISQSSRLTLSKRQHPSSSKDRSSSVRLRQLNAK